LLLTVARAGLASLLLPAALVASTPKPTIVRDPAGDASPACKDIQKVRVVATTRVKFTVTMGAKPGAKPCKGKFAPMVFIDNDNDGNGDCQATITNGVGDVRCGTEVTGSYKAAINPDNPLQWKTSFPTKAARAGKTFRIQVAIVTSGQFNDFAPDGSTEATVKVG
jgi:hypothetical protein